MNAEDVDMVNHPPHYTSKKYEVIDILEEFFKDDPLLWQCGKYLLRCKEKGNMEQDLNKMIWYANRRINTKGKKMPRGLAEKQYGKYGTRFK